MHFADQAQFLAAMGLIANGAKTGIIPADWTFTQTQILANLEAAAQAAVPEAFIMGPDNVVDGGYKEATCGNPSDPTDTSGQDACMLQDSVDENLIAPGAAITDLSSISPIADTENAVVSTTVTGINCEQDNGGCSHTCIGVGFDGNCECPNDCWELDSNELINMNGLTVSNPGYLKTCQVKADKVDLICHPDRMEAQLAQCVVEGLTNFKLGSSVCTEDTTVDGLASTDPNGHDTAILNSNSCTNLESSGGTVGGIQDTNGCLYFNIKLDECSTQVNAVSDPNNPDDPSLNYIEFTQQLSSEITETYQQEPNSPSVNLGNTLDSQFLALISNAPRVSIDFKCRYTQEYTTDSSAVATSPDDVTENLVSTGRFAYSLDTVQAVDSNGDPTFNLNNVVAWSTIHSTDPDDADAAYDVGKTLFFKICSQQDLTNIKFSVPGTFI